MEFKENIFGIEKLPSQTTLDERFGLRDLTQYRYSGEGMIFDIGSAAGGSTYCLADGLNNNLGDFQKQKIIKAFDLFDGYSIKAFSNSKAFQILRESGLQAETDLDLFKIVTAPYAPLIEAIQLDIVEDFESFAMPSKIEIAHIDAAKTAELWSKILPTISDGIIPGRTTWVFQDFERCRLPWQWLLVGELLSSEIAEITHAYVGGTLHLKLREKIPETMIQRSIKHNHSLRESADIWSDLKRRLIETIDTTTIFEGQFEDVSAVTLCYIYQSHGERELAQNELGKVSPEFLAKEGNTVYRRELVR